MSSILADSERHAMRSRSVPLYGVRGDGDADERSLPGSREPMSVTPVGVHETYRGLSRRRTDELVTRAKARLSDSSTSITVSTLAGVLADAREEPRAEP